MTLKTGVIGHPINHSLSPQIHQFWLKKHAIAGEYEAWDVSPETLSEFIRALPKNKIMGCNVTIPHKENVFKLVSVQDEAAKIIGAVNTVYVSKETGEICGINTDYKGFMAHFRQTFPDVILQEANILILGAGGAATAIIYALLQEGVANIMISNRTPGRAEAIRDRLPEKYRNKLRLTEWAERNKALPIMDMVVNTTSLGMEGQLPLEMNLSLLKEETIVADIVYTPLETELLYNARARGNPTLDGLGMLLHQAAPAFEKWYGVMPDVTSELRKHVESFL